MKKSKLIEILNAIPGNPDIKLWNGMVGDWVDIDPTPIETVLVKKTLESWLESCRLEDCIDRKDFTYQMPSEEISLLTRNYRTLHKWEINKYVTADDIKSKHYRSKKVFIIQAKKRGISSWDRAGSYSY